MNYSLLVYNFNPGTDDEILAVSGLFKTEQEALDRAKRWEEFSVEHEIRTSRTEIFNGNDLIHSL